jgi:hypothetical protein
MDNLNALGGCAPAALAPPGTIARSTSLHSLWKIFHEKGSSAP